MKIKKNVYTEITLERAKESDVFGRGSESWQEGATDDQDDFQLPIFQIELSRVKQRNGDGTASWWLRSPYASNPGNFCSVGTDGNASDGA